VDDLREERLQQQFPEWATSYTRMSESRVRWDTRAVGHDGNPVFSTHSWEHMELFLSTHDPEEIAR
jgi:hypothetical protein